MSSSQRKKQEERSLQALREIASQPHNKRCMECHQRGPTYADMATLAFVCTGCSGHLRGLNPPHRLKSISMTTFTDAEIEQLKNGGNEACRAKWQAKWDPRTDKEPDGKDDLFLIQFLREKYEKKKWYSDVPVKPQADVSAPKDSSSQVSLTKPPEVVKSPQKVQHTPPADARPRPTHSTSQSNIAHSSEGAAAVPKQQVQSATAPATTPSDPFGSAAVSNPDPFGPVTQQPVKQPPPGAVAVLPPVGQTLVPSSSSQSGEFGDFTSSTTSNKQDLASVSFQSQPVAGLGKPAGSGSDKYSALAQLDVALKETTLKDTPSQETALGASWGSGTGAPNPFGGAPSQQNLTTAQPNPFMMGGGQQNQQFQSSFGGPVQQQQQPVPGQQQQFWGGQSFGQGGSVYQGQPGGVPAGKFAKQPNVGGGFGTNAAAFPSGFSQQQQAVSQGQWQQPGTQPQWQAGQQPPQQQNWNTAQPMQQQNQPQWQQQQSSPQLFHGSSGGQTQNLGGGAGGFGAAAKPVVTSTSFGSSSSGSMGWSNSLAKPVVAASSLPATVGTTSDPGGSTGWGATLTAPVPQTGQMNWNTPSVGPPQTMPAQAGGGWGSVSASTSGSNWKNAGQQQPAVSSSGSGFSSWGSSTMPAQQTYGAGFGAQPKFQGSGQQPKGFGASTPQQGFGANPQQQGFGMNQQQQGFGTNPQQQGFGTNPQQQGFGTNPQQQGFGTNPQQQGFGTNPQQQGFGMNPQQQGFGMNPQQQGFRMNPQQQGFGMNPAQQQQAQQGFVSGSVPQQQMFGSTMPQSGAQPQAGFANWSSQNQPGGGSGFNWGAQTMPASAGQRKPSNIIVGNWGTQPSTSTSGQEFGNWQQGSNSQPQSNSLSSSSSNPFAGSSTSKGSSNNPFL